MESRHPNPEVSRELQEVYDTLPPYEKVLWDALEDVHRDDQGHEWSPYRLSEPLLTVWAVSQAQEKTNNGGFQFFFENDWPELPSYGLFALAFDRIGATEAAQALRLAVETFPFSSPHLDYGMRRDFMESSRSNPEKHDSLIDLCGKKMMDLTELNYRLLAEYIKRNLVYFPTVQRRLPSQQNEN